MSLILNKGCLVQFFFIIITKYIFSTVQRNTHMSYANSAEPDQMPHSVASDLGLDCLPMSYT